MKEFFDNTTTGVRQIVPHSNLIDKYYYILTPLLTTVSLTDKEMEYYRYKPRLFCIDRYGNIELWSTLLRVNNILSPSEFDKKTFKGFTKEFLEKLDEILIIEGDTLDANRLYVKK